MNISKAVGKKTNEYKHIKNPFVCNGEFQVRLDGDKPQTNLDTDYIMNAHNPVNGNRYLINPNNDKMSFTFGTGEEKETTDFDKFDYEVSAETLNKKRTDGKEIHKEGLPLSFIHIDNEEDGINWYKKNYPKIPDDLLPIIARYNWGDPITKKAIKNEKKKIIKTLKKDGLKVKTKEDNDNKPFILTFD